MRGIAVGGLAGHVQVAEATRVDRKLHGIRLSKGSTSVELTAFTVNVDSDPDLTALVGGQRTSILNLDLSQLEEALNQTFSTGAFKEGLLLGQATVSARAR